VLAFLQLPEAGSPDVMNWDIWMLPLGGEPQPFIESPFEELWPTFSPDGRWLAYASNQSGNFEVYVTQYPGPGPRLQISNDGGVSPAWSTDGRELLFRRVRQSDGRRSMWAVDISTEPNFVAGQPRELFQKEHLRSSPVRSYDVTLDGQSLLMLIRPDAQPYDPVAQMHVTLNWFEELKRLVPAE